MRISDSSTFDLAYDITQIAFNAFGDPIRKFDELQPYHQLFFFDMLNVLKRNTSVSYDKLYMIWYGEKLADGWSFGDAYDEKTKKSPLMVDWNKVPFELQAVLQLWVDICHRMMKCDY